MKLKYNESAHGYWLDGKRTKSVTAIVGLPDDKWTLNNWKMRQVAIGLARSPELLGNVDLDDNDKQAGNTVIEEAMKVAGSGDGAAYGTRVHKITEDGDRGLELEDEIDRALYAQWRQLLELADLEIVPEYIEGVVVFPLERVCGRFDRLARRRSNGSLVVVDLKTGASAVDYPHSTVCQLATYANAPLMCAPEWDEDGNGETEHFEPLPDELTKKVGVVIHMPQDDLGGVYDVNLRLGWQCMQQIVFPGLRWRATPSHLLIKKVV